MQAAPIPEDWGGNGSSRMTLSQRCTAISDVFVDRQYHFFDTNMITASVWQVAGMPGAFTTAQRRLLTWHPGGASTSRVELPPQFQAPAGTFTADLEIFVLSGTLQLDEWQLSKHGYSFIPAGVKVGPWRVLGDKPAEILWMENGLLPLQYQPSAHHHADAKLCDFIPALDCKLLPWGKTDTTQFATGHKKWIRKDSSGGGAWLLTILPHYDGHYPEIQCYNEEAYCLAGTCDIGSYHFSQGHFGYCPSFSTIPRHSTVDGGLFFVRIDRDLSQPGTVLSYMPQ